MCRLKSHFSRSCNHYERLKIRFLPCQLCGKWTWLAWDSSMRNLWLTLHCRNQYMPIKRNRLKLHKHINHYHLVLYFFLSLVYATCVRCTNKFRADNITWLVWEHFEIEFYTRKTIVLLPTGRSCVVSIPNTQNIGPAHAGVDPLAELETRYPNLASMPPTHGEQSQQHTDGAHTAADAPRKTLVSVFRLRIIH